ISFVERECFHEGRKAMHDFPDDSCLLPINIKARWQHDQVRTTLQRHESGHGRANTEGARFIVTGSENAASIARAPYPNKLALQFASEQQKIAAGLKNDRAN